jgi:hypothetical protein
VFAESEALMLISIYWVYMPSEDEDGHYTQDIGWFENQEIAEVTAAFYRCEVKECSAVKIDEKVYLLAGHPPQPIANLNPSKILAEVEELKKARAFIMSLSPEEQELIRKYLGKL